MKQTSNLTRKLAEAQENHARASLVHYRIYTEDITPSKEQPSHDELVSRYFKGFTLLSGTGYYEGEREHSLIIDIVAPPNALQDVVNLAGDIKQVYKQYSVLVTFNHVTAINVR